MNLHITHISTACVLLEIGSVRILTDPVFDTGDDEYGFGFGVYVKRRVGPAWSPELCGKLQEIDAALLSHPHHADNLDPSGRIILERAREIITAFEEVHEFPDRRVTGLKPWSTVTVFGRGGEKITVTATPARHGWRCVPNARLKFDATHVRGFILEWEGQEHGPLYISGDTLYYKELAKQVAGRKIGTALLHLGGANFWPPAPRFLRYTFTSKKAARFARELGPTLKKVIPIHYEEEVWSHFQGTKVDYNKAFEDAGAPALTWLTRGVRTRL